jgi:DNA-binding response OmpR family regulator
MLPKTLALVDDDTEYTQFLAQYLRERDVVVDVFTDSNRLLVHPNAYSYGFYVVELTLSGIDGINLIKVLRLHTDAGILVVSGHLAPEVFAAVFDAGGDMHLAKPVQIEQIALAVKAIVRRAAAGVQSAPPWRLDLRGRQLVAPDGVRIDLSDSDRTVLQCFLEADGASVTRETLRQRLGQPSDAGASDGLSATIYRLRRRIERATPTVVPLQSKSRVGYVFKAPLKPL